LYDSVTVQNRTHVYMNFFDHEDLGNHLLELRPKVVKCPVCRRHSWIKNLETNTEGMWRVPGNESPAAVWLVHGFGLKGMDMSCDVNVFLLPNDGCTLLNTELNNRLSGKGTHRKSVTFQPQRN
jgi:hypothetical protein